jgi:opacity protein-like surface antigen
MNKRISNWLSVALCATAVGWTAQAQDAGSNWYFRAGLGASLPADTEVKEFLGAGGGGDVGFDPGFSFDVAGGYRVTPWLGVEVETGFRFNSFEDTSDTSLTQIPFMANAVVQCNHFKHFVPFVGVGVGGVASILDIDEEIFVGEGTIRLEGSESDLVFAYQAFAGVRYDFNDRMGVGLMYRFMGTMGPAWDVEGDGFDDEQIELDDVFTHSISVMFHMQF